MELCGSRKLTDDECRVSAHEMLSELGVDSEHVLSVELRVEAVEDVHDDLIRARSGVVAYFADRTSLDAFGGNSQPHIARELDGGMDGARIAHNEEHELELVLFDWKIWKGKP